MVLQYTPPPFFLDDLLSLLALPSFPTSFSLNYLILFLEALARLLPPSFLPSLPPSCLPSLLTTLSRLKYHTIYGAARLTRLLLALSSLGFTLPPSRPPSSSSFEDGGRESGGREGGRRGWVEGWMVAVCEKSRRTVVSPLSVFRLVQAARALARVGWREGGREGGGAGARFWQMWTEGMVRGLREGGREGGVGWEEVCGLVEGMKAVNWTEKEGREGGGEEGPSFVLRKLRGALGREGAREGGREGQVRLMELLLEMEEGEGGREGRRDKHGLFASFFAAFQTSCCSSSSSSGFQGFFTPSSLPSSPSLPPSLVLPLLRCLGKMHDPAYLKAMYFPSPFLSALQDHLLAFYRFEEEEGREGGRKGCCPY